MGSEKKGIMRRTYQVIHSMIFIFYLNQEIFARASVVMQQVKQPCETRASPYWRTVFVSDPPL